MKEAFKHIKVGVSGSRTFARLDLVRLVVQELGPCVIVSGGAVGVDTVAVEEAKRLGYPEPVIFLPDWKQYGKPAGMIRNKKIIEFSDGMTIFWDGKSKGTHGALIESKRAKKPIILVHEDGKFESIGWEPCPKS